MLLLSFLPPVAFDHVGDRLAQSISLGRRKVGLLVFAEDCQNTKLSLTGKQRRAHFSRYFCITARKSSRKSARAMPKAILARRKPALEPQSCRSPSNSTP